MKGQSLIEVLLALSIAAIILGAITTAVISSLRNAQFAKNQNLATQLASQGIEIIRGIRDREVSLVNYLAECSQGTCCLDADGTLEFRFSCNQNVGTPDVGSGSPYLYIRTVEILEGHSGCNATDTYYVEVSVSWWDNACDNPIDFCHKVKLASCFVKEIGIPPSSSL